MDSLIDIELEDLGTITDELLAVRKIVIAGLDEFQSIRSRLNELEVSNSFEEGSPSYRSYKNLIDEMQGFVFNLTKEFVSKASLKPLCTTVYGYKTVDSTLPYEVVVVVKHEDGTWRYESFKNGETVSAYTNPSEDWIRGRTASIYEENERYIPMTAEELANYGFVVGHPTSR